MPNRKHWLLGIIQGGIDRKVVPFDPKARAKRNAALARERLPHRVVSVRPYREPMRSMGVQTGPEAA